MKRGRSQRSRLVGGVLAHSDLTAAQVGFRLGFEDPAYFARFFRREAGVPPTSFRAGARGARGPITSS